MKFKIPVIPIRLFSLGLAILLSFNWFTVSFANDAADQISLVREIEIDDPGIKNQVGLADSQNASAYHVLESQGPRFPLSDQNEIVLETSAEDRLGSAHSTASISEPFNTAFENITAISTEPLLPVLVSPADGASGTSTSPNLEVAVSDPDGDNLTVTFYGRPAGPSSNSDFTIIAMPDTQHYTDDPANYANFSAQTQWIVDNRVPLNIQFVTHLGDVVENGNNFGDDTEWQVADGAMSLLEDPLTTTLTDGIPFGVAPGNHDLGDTGNDATGESALFNQFFGVTRFQGRDYYGGSHNPAINDNNYELFSAGGYQFIIFHFEYDNAPPNSAVLNWADNLLKIHGNRRGIVTTHYLMNGGSPPPFSVQGQAIYDALKDNPNLFLMLGGHRSNEARRTDIYNGSSIHSLLSDYQNRTNGGDGWLRIMEFSPVNNEIRVKTYSPTLDQYETDANSQFTLPYDMQGSDFQVIGTNSNVPSGSNTSMPWPGLFYLTEYEWYATVTDGDNEITSATWSFTTGPPINSPPSVTIVPDQQTISLPSDAALDGTVTDDGLPNPPAAYTVLWTKTSGPGVVTFANDTLEDTTASFSAPGQYVLRLTANDSAMSAFDEITIVVNSATNQPPSVDAGSPQTITHPDFALLDGNVTDDGLPNPPGSYSTLWSKVSGPGLVTFEDAGAVDTTASFSASGVYVLRLTADDGGKSDYDEVTITVLPATNQPPTVFAGAPQTITLPGIAVLDGTVTDDGLGNSDGKLDIMWTVSISPGLVTFANPQSADTTAAFSKAGEYELRLTAYDGEYYVEDPVTITVNPIPIQNIWLPILFSFSSR